MNPETTGIVVAGGYSTRFGDREKALAELDGRPMLRRVVDALSAVTDEVVVNCRPAQQEAFAAALPGLESDVRYVLDEETDSGPLAGLLNGLAAVDTELAVVLGCDMPLVERDALRALIDQARQSNADAVVPQTDGGPEPLHGVYRVDPARKAARAVLDDGQRSLRALLNTISITEIPIDTGAVPSRSVTSVDTQAHLRELQARLENGE